MSMMTLRYLLLHTLFLCCVGCARSTRFVHLQVHVEDDAARPLAGVLVELDRVTSARTDTRGDTQLTVPERSEPFTLRIQCPATHDAAPPRTVRPAPGVRDLRLSLVCHPRLRKLAIAVRAANATGALVRVDGAALGSIAADGTLHALVERPKASELRVSIDTSALPTLVPQQPARDFHVSDRDDVLLFDQAFAQAPPAVRKRRVQHPASVPLPYAIERHGAFR